MAGRAPKSINTINTFVSFDIETTGLPSQECWKTKITELALIAVSKEHLLNTATVIPRVAHKLIVCFYPSRMIQPIAAEITGLSNELLEKEKVFDNDACNLINSFFSRLTPPICLVAHNGKRFDFPLLLTEFAESHSALPDDLYCLDSLDTFKQIFSEIPVEMMPHYMQKRVNKSCSPKKTDLHLDKNTGESTSVSVISEDRSFMQKINESTPIKNKELDRPVSKVLETIKAKRRLFKNENEELQPSLESYKLGDVYKFIYGKNPVQAHLAENDALILVACMTALGPDFMKVADEKALLINDLKCVR